MLQAIEADELTKTYPGGVTAVDKVSFSIEKGEIFGFLGRNGAGKSTTIKMLTTLTRPTAGKALLNGIDVAERPNEARMQFGYVSQDLAVDDNLTGWENMLLQSKYYHMPFADARKAIETALRLVDLTERANQSVSTYSGGMRKRLDIACALVHRPSIIILDEPTLGLDIQTRREIWNYLQVLKNEYGTTVFLTTHYMEEADQLCDRISILESGALKITDTPERLKSSLGGDVVALETGSPISEQQVELIRNEVMRLPFVKEWKEEEASFRLCVEDGGAALPVVMHIFQSAEAAIDHISIKKPSLDDVFLKYTGTRIRDRNEEGQDAFKHSMAIGRVRK